MSNLLKAQVALLLALVLVCVFVRVSVIQTSADTPDDPPGHLQNPPGDNTAPQAKPTDPTEPSHTEPPPTEPPIKLTFGEDFTLACRNFFVYDCAEENLMASSCESFEKIYPASITKLFTAHVALLYLDPDATVKVGTEVNLVPSDSSLAYLKKDQVISVTNLIKGMLLPSGNDAAYALAVAAARAESGNRDMSVSMAMEHFIGLMNAEAQNQGMVGSHFANPDGYHDFEHYTTNVDLITIARLALSNEVIRQCASTTSQRLEFSNGEVALWKNTNHLIDPQSQYYRENAVGLKTGHTSYAGFCVLSAFEWEGDYIIVGTFGCQRPEDRYIDALKLYDLAAAAKSQ